MSAFWVVVLIGISTASGMLLGAWFAARGFEKSLVKMMDDPDAPWNADDE